MQVIKNEIFIKKKYSYKIEKGTKVSHFSIKSESLGLEVIEKKS